jgi:sterol desaturase/sphingolipid hydroxylase (fatty acid hydroxylase superfamily)
MTVESQWFRRLLLSDLRIVVVVNELCGAQGTTVLSPGAAPLLFSVEGPMEFYPSFSDLWARAPNQLGVVFAPVFLFTILAEALAIQARQGRYPWRNTGVSLMLAVGHLVSQAAVHGLIFSVIAAGVYSLRLTTIPVSFLHWPALVALFVLTELAFYVEHRSSHRVALLWASHSVHHSTERMVTSAAFRLSWTPILSGVFLFYLPIVWFGFDPVWVFGMASASLTYQFFVHTELVPRIGWLEWVVNTPSAHRVHHASNPEYIDKNFGGVLMVWDHLLGTYQAERRDVAIRYGLSHPRSAPGNPFVIAYGGLVDLMRGVARAGSWRERLTLVFGPP